MEELKFKKVKLTKEKLQEYLFKLSGPISHKDLLLKLRFTDYEICSESLYQLTMKLFKEGNLRFVEDDNEGELAFVEDDKISVEFLRTI